MSLLRADARHLPLADCCVQACVTSPPYLGQRDYGQDAQIGLERSPQAYVAELVTVFREVRRVLRDDGVLWLNLGDSYAGSRCGADDGSTLHGSRRNQSEVRRARASMRTASRRRDDLEVPRSDIAVEGLKPKDLMGLPWRVAFALQADGWWLRMDNIWHKPNPMPESVTDRTTRAHEYVFLLSKSERYQYDVDAVREPHAPDSIRRYEYGLHSRAPQDGLVSAAGSGPTNVRALGRSERMGDNMNMAGRNLRSVWTIPTQPYDGPHFAAFPEALVRRCVLAGSRLGDLVLDPFGGSGTTARVAISLGRRAVCTELNPAYLHLARDRSHVTRGLPLEMVPCD